VRSLVLGQITRVRTREVAEAAFVRFLALVQRADVRLQLRVRGGRVPAAVAHVGAFAGVGALVVVLCLVCGERLVAACVAACVRSVACVAEQVARELRALLEVFGGCVTAFPLAEAGGAVVDVGGFDVLMEGGGGGEDGETEQAWRMLPLADAS
jgi:hypothetical protein